MTPVALRLETKLAATLETFTCMGLLDITASPYDTGLLVSVIVERTCLVHRWIEARGKTADHLMWEIVRLDGDRICWIAETAGVVVYSASGNLAASVSIHDLRSLALRATT